MGFAVAVWVLTLYSFPDRESPRSDFASRDADVKAALAMHSGRIAEGDTLRRSDFSAMPASLDVVTFPALFVNGNGEHCFALGTATAEGGDSLVVRCIDRTGAIIRRGWSELKTEATGVLSLQKGRMPTARIGKGEVQLSWLVWDFGATKSGRPYTAEFRLLNGGDFPVVIKRLNQSCTCVEARHKHDLPMTVSVGEAADFAFVIEQVTQAELSLQATFDVECDGTSEMLQLRIFGVGEHPSGLPAPPENVADVPDAVSLSNLTKGELL